MKAIKLRITEYREQSFTRSAKTVANLARVDSDLAAKRARVGQLQELQKAVKIQERVDELARVSLDIDALFTQRAAIELDEQNAAESAAQAARSHAMVGKGAWQIVNDENIVEGVVDENGDPFPKGVTYCAEVADVEAPRPPWFERVAAAA